MGLIDRVFDICLRPRATFVEIEREKAGFTALYRGYLLWLAALAPAIDLVVGLARAADGSSLARVGFLSAGALLDYVCVLAGVYVLAVAVDALAPFFGGERNEDQALRLCVYALTPSFIAGAIASIPGLGWSAVLSLYAIALMIIGLPKLMHCPNDRALGYGASAAVAIAAITLATSELTSRVLAQS